MRTAWAVLIFCKQKIFEKKKRDSLSTVSFVLALPIFPARLQASIFGVNELNFRVRNGNGWTLVTINTNSVLPHLQNRTK